MPRRAYLPVTGNTWHIIQRGDNRAVHTDVLTTNPFAPIAHARTGRQLSRKGTWLEGPRRNG